MFLKELENLLKELDEIKGSLIKINFRNVINEYASKKNKIVLDYQIRKVEAIKIKDTLIIRYFLEVFLEGESDIFVSQGYLKVYKLPNGKIFSFFSEI